MSNERVYDLTFEVLPGGGIELEQGFMEVNRVSLHQCHVQLLFERAGHLLPPPPADELARRLARQLCELRLELVSEYGRSPGVNEAITMLGAFCDALPDSVFPFDLYPDNSPEVSPREEKRPEFQLTHLTMEDKPCSTRHTQT